MNSKTTYTQQTGIISFLEASGWKLRVVDLSKQLDPATERRRCKVRRDYVVVNGVGDYHSELDLASHLGTHLELPYHHNNDWKDVTQFPIESFVGRGVLLNLRTARPNQLIGREDLDAADKGKVKPGDTVLLDSPFHSEPFSNACDDRRPDLSEEAAYWFLEKQVKCVGWGDGIAIENNREGCIAFHDLLLAKDILFLEVLKNLDQLRNEIFLIVYAPLPIVGLDSSPVRVVAIEGLSAM
jgi:kynurenine formamidase